MKPIVTRFATKLTHADHLLVLMKLRLGLKNKDLVYRFNLTFDMVSKFFRNWIKILSKFMADNVIYWPEKPALRGNLPGCSEDVIANVYASLTVPKYLLSAH